MTQHKNSKEIFKKKNLNLFISTQFGDSLIYIWNK